MKAEHTKGPWQILPEEADKDYIRIRGTVWGGRYKVANVPTPTYEGVLPREVEETRANARLIAAAPDLLAALEGLLSIAGDSRGVAGYHLNGDIAEWGEFEEVSAALDVLAKAKGE